MELLGSTKLWGLSRDSALSEKDESMLKAFTLIPDTELDELFSARFPTAHHGSESQRSRRPKRRVQSNLRHSWVPSASVSSSETGTAQPATITNTADVSDAATFPILGGRDVGSPPTRQEKMQAEAFWSEGYSQVTQKPQTASLAHKQEPCRAEGETSSTAQGFPPILAHAAPAQSKASLMWQEFRADEEAKEAEVLTHTAEDSYGFESQQDSAVASAMQGIRDEAIKKWQQFLSRHQEFSEVEVAFDLSDDSEADEEQPQLKKAADVRSAEDKDEIRDASDEDFDSENQTPEKSDDDGAGKEEGGDDSGTITASPSRDAEALASRAEQSMPPWRPSNISSAWSQGSKKVSDALGIDQTIASPTVKRNMTVFKRRLKLDTKPA